MSNRQQPPRQASHGLCGAASLIATRISHSKTDRRRCSFSPRIARRRARSEHHESAADEPDEDELVGVVDEARRRTGSRPSVADFPRAWPRRKVSTGARGGGGGGGAAVWKVNSPAAG